MAFATGGAHSNKRPPPVKFANPSSFRHTFEASSGPVRSANVCLASASEAPLSGALLDRLTHHVHILEIVGDSHRLKSSLEKGKDKPA